MVLFLVPFLFPSLSLSYTLCYLILDVENQTLAIVTHLIVRLMRPQLNVINIVKIIKITCRNIIKNLLHECRWFPSYKENTEPQGRPAFPCVSFRGLKFAYRDESCDAKQNLNKGNMNQYPLDNVSSLSHLKISSAFCK